MKKELELPYLFNLLASIIYILSEKNDEFIQTIHYSFSTAEFPVSVSDLMVLLVYSRAMMTLL